MKILFYSPYLDTLGGGERYTFELIDFFLKREDNVDLAWREEGIKRLTKERFKLDIERVKIIPSLYRLFNNKKKLIEKYKITSAYDVIFIVSDGSIPFLFGKKNLLHFQVPFKNIDGGSLFNQLKLRFIHKIICNSFFTKKFIDQEFMVDSEILYPPVCEEFKIGEKENIILSVGRFDNVLNSKKQDVLVKVFVELLKEEQLKNWKFLLIGNVIDRNEFIKYLQNLAKGFPVEIKTNVNFETLKRIYAKAKIYWHAAGFAEDLLVHPEKAEHFGISVVEAMRASCVPIVFNGGGLPEIIQNNKNGFLFTKLSELKEITLRVARNENLSKEISKKAVKRSENFSKKIFFKKLSEIIK